MLRFEYIRPVTHKSMSWAVDGGLCALLGKDVAVRVEFPRINEKEGTKEKMNVPGKKSTRRAMWNVGIGV